jgi:pre-rRNA-processing protein TSR3
MAPTIILRHRKENLKKCSLTPLHQRDELSFFTYPGDLERLPIVSQTIVLTMGAPPLPVHDSAPLLLIDGTWRLAEVMLRQVQRLFGPRLRYHSLPACVTAYPRRQTGCEDPDEGLASVEALYLAHRITGRSTDGLLDGYHWKAEFLDRNRELWERIAFERENALK